MKKITLPVVPYNDDWINCMDNNIISILTSISGKFRNLPSVYEPSYAIRFAHNPNLMQVNDEYKYNQIRGWFSLKVANKRPNLSKWLLCKNCLSEIKKTGMFPLD
ncbi:MAG: hypothetical protein JWM44_1942 [Bacilli bacterium]|nr:hypothetical protein [Bacilli bacterium]